jgi:hypothetical protein
VSIIPRSEEAAKVFFMKQRLARFIKETATQLTKLQNKQ